VFVIHRRAHAQKWRLRGRRGQVAPVATILGLLLVVTFIANYLSTTLPNQMSVNDLNHVLEVENQIGRLQALLEGYTAHDAINAQLTQPVTLGSAAAPPFAGADAATIGPSTIGSGYSLSYQLTGPLAFTPPTGGTPGGYASSCALTDTATIVQLACSSVAHVTYNFTGTPTSGFSFALSGGGTFNLNVTTSGTAATPETITAPVSAAAPMNLLVLGSNVSLTLTISTGSTAHILEYGSNDSVTITNAAVVSSVSLYAVGYHDTVSITSGSSLTFSSYLFGADDSVTMATGSGTANSATSVSVRFVGYTASTSACPNDNLAATDSVKGSNTNGHYTATYNVTTAFTPGAVADWTQTANVVASSQASCPFEVAVMVSVAGGERSADLDVHLLNTYIPQSDVAFDAGAVVFAQPGGTPILIDPPGLSVTIGPTDTVSAASLWFPIFVGVFPTDSGIATTEISARLISDTTIVLGSSSSYSVANNSNIVFTVTTPFAAGWMSYFESNPAYAGWYSCAPSTSVACVGPYAAGGPLGTVTLTIPTGSALTSFTVQVATFAVSLV
jgi:hypothetical protein